MSTERQTFVEIDLPVCSLTYGESPCTAVLNGGDPDDFGINANNTRKCYNTRSTCQDLPNYDGDDIATPPKVLRLAVATLNLDPGIMAIPSIVDVSYTPPRINLAQGLGERSVVKITVQDHPFPDTGPAGDKYLDERDFDAFGLGTFWGKFRTRYPFMRGRTLRWKTGIVGTTIDNMETRQFVIDRIDGPDVSGRVVITAKDPVTLLDDQRALTPKLSSGQLTSAATGTITTLFVSPDSLADYPSGGGFISVGGTEIMQYSSTTGPATINISARARFGTPQVDHAAEERVQLCRVIDDGSGGAIRADQFLLKLLTEDDVGTAGGGPIPTQFITAANWQFEAETFLSPSASGNFFSGVITEPEPIADIVNEFCRSIGASIWWNDLEQQLKFRVLRIQGTDDNRLYSDAIILADTFQQRTLERSRISRAWIFYAPLNALEQTEDKNNYLQAFVNVSPLSEELYGTASATQIFSRFIRGGARDAAIQTAEFLLARYALPPRQFVFTIPRDDDEFIHLPSLGETILVSSRFIQDDTGQQQTRECEVVGLIPTSTTMTIEAEEINRSDVIPPRKVANTFVIPIDSDVTTGINMSTLIATELAEQDITPGDVIRIVVEAGVMVTNTTTRSIFERGPFGIFGFLLGRTPSPTAAMITGDDLPAGVTIQLELKANAMIVGQGGRGGSATVQFNTQSAGQGGNGRDGLIATQAGLQVIMDPTSTIAGGGGGGAGAAGRGTVQSGIFSSAGFTAASGGGGFPFGQAGLASKPGLEGRRFRTSISQGSLAGKENVGAGNVASLSISAGVFFPDRRTIVSTSGAGGDLGDSGEGSSTSSANAGSATHATGGDTGFSIKGRANMTISPVGNIIGPEQSAP